MSNSGPMEPKHASSCGVPGERRPAVDGRDAGGVVSGEAEQLPGGSGGRRTIGVAGLDGDADDVASLLDDNGECGAWLRERDAAVRRPTAAPVAASARAVGKGSSYTVADNMQPLPRAGGLPVGLPRTCVLDRTRILWNRCAANVSLHHSSTASRLMLP